MRGAAALLLFAIGGCAGFDAPSAAPLTRNETRAMPPERLARRVLGDVARTLLPLPVPPADRWPRSSVLSEVAFVTPPRFTGYRGLCETDFVLVRMVPAGELDGADTPVRPARLELTTEYVVRDSAAIVAGGELSARDEDREQAACARLDPRPAARIRAGEASDAARGLRLAFAFVSAARSGRSPAPLACSLDDPDGASPEARCLSEVAAMRLEDINLIGSCNDPAFPAGECWAISNWAIQLRIWVRPGTEEPIRAAVEHVVVVT